jgi:hypothetical protein
MPQDDPGSLTADQYDGAVAYILQQNGYPAGTIPLSDATPNVQALDLSR